MTSPAAECLGVDKLPGTFLQKDTPTHPGRDTGVPAKKWDTNQTTLRVSSSLLEARAAPLLRRCPSSPATPSIPGMPFTMEIRLKTTHGARAPLSQLQGMRLLAVLLGNRKAASSEQSPGGGDCNQVPQPGLIAQNDPCPQHRQLSPGSP